jgi:hypothetical protein
VQESLFFQPPCPHSWGKRRNAEGLRPSARPDGWHGRSGACPCEQSPPALWQGLVPALSYVIPAKAGIQETVRACVGARFLMSQTPDKECSGPLHAQRLSAPTTIRHRHRLCRFSSLLQTEGAMRKHGPLKQRARLWSYSFISSLTFAVKAGRACFQSPTIPNRASRKMLDSGSLLMATMVLDPEQPAIC